MKLEPIEKLSGDDLAEVFIGRLVGDGPPLLVTVRRLAPQVAEIPGLVDSLRQASDAAQRYRHAHLVRHLGLTEAGGSLCWVSERPFGFDLATVFKRMASREVHLAPLRALQMGLDLLAGLGVLHEHGEIHGGMDPLDVLVGYDGATRLDAAGLARILLSARELKQIARRGRDAHLAPEVAQGREPTVGSDVYTAAAILYHLLTGTAPAETDEQGGASVSVRHAAVQPPSKLDRSLPYSCDAVFVKALGSSASSRHESVASLNNAVGRLRAAMRKGTDEGRGGVAEFVRGLFPNEALVAGQPGTLERPAVAEGVEVEGLVLPADEPELGEDEDTPPDGAMQMEEDTPPDGTVPAKVAQASAAGSNPTPPPMPAAPASQPGEADEDALARIRAWESMHGGTGDQGAGKPPPLGRGRTSPKPGPPPVPGRRTEQASAGQEATSQAGTSGDASSVVVDWNLLSDPPAAAEESPQVETVRDGKPLDAPGQRPRGPDRPLEKAKTPIVDRETLKPLNQPTPAAHKQPAQKGSAGQAGAGAKAGDTPAEDAPGQAGEAQEAPAADGATRPDWKLVETPPAGRSPWRRPVVMFLAGVLVAAVALVVMVLAGVFTSAEEPARAPAGAVATEVGFLTVRADRPVEIVLDGEVLPATAALEHKLVRAGKHRVVVTSTDGAELLDEAITVEPGEKRLIRLVMTPPRAPGEADAGADEGQAIKKGARRKRPRRRRSRRKRRTRRVR